MGHDAHLQRRLDRIVRLVKQGARVINLSLGFDQECSPLEAAVQFAYAKGATVVSASGNDGDHGNPLSFPASYEHVITAAAISSALTVAPFSNYDDYVDIAAPGVDVPVDVPIRWDTKDNVVDGRAKVSGTSFSSPFIAAASPGSSGAGPTSTRARSRQSCERARATSSSRAGTRTPDTGSYRSARPWPRPHRARLPRAQRCPRVRAPPWEGDVREADHLERWTEDHDLRDR